MAKCVCLGSQPEHAMRFAILYPQGGVYWLDYNEKYGCGKLIHQTFLCTRERDHGGPCRSCRAAGFNGPCA